MTTRLRSLVLSVVFVLGGVTLVAQPAQKNAPPKVTSPQQFLGHSTGGIPRLYQKYIGHDNSPCRWT